MESVHSKHAGEERSPDGGYLQSLREKLKDSSYDKKKLLSEVQRFLVEYPLSENGFALLGELYEELEKIGESVVAMERALQLKKLNEGYQRSKAALRLEDLQEANRRKRPVVVQGFAFPVLRMVRNRWGCFLEGRSLDGDAEILIEVSRADGVRKSFAEEDSLFQSLSQAGCCSVAEWLASGEMAASTLLESDAVCENALLTQEATFPFRVQRFQADDRGYYLSDIVLALLELQGLGYCLLDIDTENIRYDSNLGLVRFQHLGDCDKIDNPSTMDLGPEAYLIWLDKKLSELDSSIGERGIWHQYTGLQRSRDLNPFFDKGKLILNATHAFEKQKCTGHPSGSIHQLSTGKFVLQGERSLGKKREVALRKLFPENDKELVLDAGCGAGAVSFRLGNHGYQVIGFDIDQQVMTGCQQLANAERLQCSFRTLDLDYAESLPAADTVLALSLLQHTLDPQNCAQKLAKAARKRILFEGGIREKGFKHSGTSFQEMDGWEFDTVTELKTMLKSWFPEFSLNRDPVQVEGDRWIIELIRI